MKFLVTGSSGHLGEGLVRRLRECQHDVIGLDLKPSPYTTVAASITDRGQVRRCMQGVDVVLHTATLHKPHIATHSRQDFVDTNISGTLVLLEEAVAAGVASFVFTSTTSVFGRALYPTVDEPSVWVTEDLVPIPRNVYGVTKLAAENLCELVHRDHALACVVLRTSRFFPEADDDPAQQKAFADLNLKANEFLHRRIDLEDVVTAHLCAAERAECLGFDRFIITATPPFQFDEQAELRTDPRRVVARHYPQFEEIYARIDFRMYDDVSRVYDNKKAIESLGWQPMYDFGTVLNSLACGRDPRSPLAIAVGAKGYHDQPCQDAPKWPS